MAQSLLTPLNFAPLSAAPASPVNGQAYYDTTLTAFRVYQNGAWVSLASGGGGASLGTTPLTRISPTLNGAAGSGTTASPIDHTHDSRDYAVWVAMGMAG